MKQIITLVLVMVFTSYYAQTTATSTSSNQQENVMATFHPNTMVDESVEAEAAAPQYDKCPARGNLSTRIAVPGTGCKQYAYCVYKNDGSRQLFSSYIYTCTSTAKFNPVSKKCTAVYNCNS